MRSSTISIEPNVRSGKDSETLVAARGILYGIGAGALCWAMILIVSLLPT